MNLKHPVHAAGKLQARCRPSGNITIGVKSNHSNRKWRLNFLQCRELFFGYSYHENKTCFEKSIARVLIWRGYTVGKIMGSWWKSHVFKSWHENMTFSSWPNDLTHCVPHLYEILCYAFFRTGLAFTVAITTTKKFSVLKNSFHKNGPTWWFSTSETSVALPSVSIPMSTNLYIPITELNHVGIKIFCQGSVKT